MVLSLSTCTLCVWEILEYDHGFKKVIEQCCPVTLFIMMFKVVQTNGVGLRGDRGSTSIKIDVALQLCCTEWF